MAIKKVIAKKATVKKPVMKRGGAKKPLAKAQTGKQTAFQQYMKNPGATASDTTMTTIQGYYPSSPKAKNPTNQKALENAWVKTYGQDWRSERYSLDPNETMDQYKRRMGPTQRKKGGSTSSAKMKEGGSTDKKWIQKAINPKHKGYCTPMTKPTCTPKRKALAKTLKAMAKARKSK